MAKTYGAKPKWTKGQSRIVRVTNQDHLLRGLKESAKMVFDNLPWAARKKRSWER